MDRVAIGELKGETQLTIKEALEQLRVVIPAEERTIFITFEVKDYNHYPADDPKRTQVEFRVWDEEGSYFAPTLEIAVQKCLLANVPDQAKIEEVEAHAVEAVSQLSVAAEVTA